MRFPRANLLEHRVDGVVVADGLHDSTDSEGDVECVPVVNGRSDRETDGDLMPLSRQEASN